MADNRKNIKPASTQQFLPIDRIQDGVIILKDGRMRVVTKVTPINFDLKSEQEKETSIYQFQSFLNSLKFPIQIVMQSRRVDLSLYIKKVEEITAKETNELLQQMAKDYLEFIKMLGEQINIMDKSFYLIVGHNPQGVVEKQTLIDKIFQRKKVGVTQFTDKEFQDYKGILMDKVRTVSGRLNSLGLMTKDLETKELIELLYNTYNPEEAVTEHLGESEQLTAPVIGDESNQVSDFGNQPTVSPTQPNPATSPTTGIPVGAPAALNIVNNASSVAPSVPANPQANPAAPVVPNLAAPLADMPPPIPGAPVAPPPAPTAPVTATQAGTPPQLIKQANLSDIMHRFGIEAHSNTPDAIFRQGVTNLLDIISPAGLNITPNFIQLGNFYVRTLFVYTYPRYLQTNWLSPIINYDTTLDIGMLIYPLETGNLITQLRRKTTQLQSTAQIESEKGLVRNPELDTAIGDIEELRDTLQKGETRLFQMGLYFTLYSTTLEELNKLSKQFEAILGGSLTYSKQALLQMEQGFNATLPIMDDQLEIMRNLDTNSLSTAFPFTSAELSHHDGVLYGINLHNSSLILFDRFKMENANQVVFAKSGAGKSYAVKLEALRSLMMGSEIIIIDPENEYKPLTESVGGTYVNISLNSSQRINPFDLPKYQSDTLDTGEQILRTTVNSVHGLVGMMVGGLSPEEDSLLDKALYETYSLKDITPDPATHTNPVPTISDLASVLANMSGTESLVSRLAKYSEGSFANLFNSQTNIDVTNKLTTFSIRDMEDELRPIAMYLVLNFIWARVKSELKKRLLLADEAWLMMRYEDSAKFMNAIVKRARKYYLGVTVISQDVEDFLNSSYGRSVVSNSATQLLLGQSTSSIDKLAEIFKLTDGEKFFLTEAEVGQGLFFAGTNRAAMQIVASYTEDQVITTDPKQLLEIYGIKH